MSSEVVHELTRGHISKLASEDKRMDGRGLEEVRALTVEKGYARNAEGSARIHLGNTDVLVGIKMELGTPYSDRPDAGVLITNAELVPLASPNFESGPPRENAIELARVVDRGIRETGTVDFKTLCIEPGEQVWLLFMDLHILDYDGNLFDACSYGALAALLDTTVPVQTKLGEDAGEDFDLEVKHHPITLTTAKIDGRLFVDPNLDEERIAEARLTVTTDEDSRIRAMQKGLRGSFTVEEVDHIVSLSQKLSKDIRKTIVEA